ncbi:MAG: hypothetical protein AAF742_01235 [Pseudomonadota bacterium]
MKVLGMRFCGVVTAGAAEPLADMFSKLGLESRPLDMPEGSNGFNGAIFPIGEQSSDTWIEIWPSGPQMPELVMLQLVVDDADAFAAHAKSNGLNPKGPDDANGERIYYLEGPGGLPLSFQSKID